MLVKQAGLGLEFQQKRGWVGRYKLAGPGQEIILHKRAGVGCKLSGLGHGDNSGTCTGLFKLLEVTADFCLQCFDDVGCVMGRTSE